jgi:translation initiation factor IF-1
MDENHLQINEEKGLIEVKGIVREILPDFTFRVELENGKIMLAKGSGRLRKKRIRISVLDKVLVEISQYGLEFGRIARRLDDRKEENKNFDKKGKKNEV